LGRKRDERNTALKILIFALNVGGDVKFGGSGRFMKCVANTLKDLGHEVTTDIENDCDLIIASHNTNQIKDKKARKIFISHGIVPEEVFKEGADKYISISEEVKQAQLSVDSDVIAQPVPMGLRNQPAPSLKNILIISRKEQQAPGNPFDFLSQHYNIKYSDQTEPIENQINWADLCITLGRGALDSMAQGKPVLIADNRYYMGAVGDGYVNHANIKEIALNNFSGRRFRIPVTEEWLLSELEKYNPDDSIFLYNYVLENHDPIKIIQKYLHIPTKKNIHLVMPFWRHENKETLINAYQPMNIILHPIMFQDEVAEFDKEWIFPLIIPMDSKDCNANLIECFKRNYYIQNATIEDEDYYVMADDDDLYESGVFDAIKKLDSEVVIISMKRGDSIPDSVKEARAYPTTTLYAHPNSVFVEYISAQQLIVKGKIFRRHEHKDKLCWDGELAEQYKKLYEIEYKPNLYALFNFFEPGRWDRPVKINLGCGNKKLDGYTNIDIQERVNPDIVCDVLKGLPYENNSVDEVRAWDFLEHIKIGKTIGVIEEIWRVLKPGGKFESFTPDAEYGQGAFQDPTHVSFWVEDSWLYFSVPVYRDLYDIKASFKIEMRRINTDPMRRIFHIHVVAIKTITEKELPL